WVTDAATAKKAGVPVMQIATDILGQKGTVAAYAAIAEGERYTNAGPIAAVAAPTVKAAPTTFARTGAEITYTPEPEELEPVLAKLGLDPQSAPTSAVFRVDGGQIEAVTPAFGPDGMHPVV